MQSTEINTSTNRNASVTIVLFTLKYYTTRSTGTVHTSAKARLTTVAISVPPSGEAVWERHENAIICLLAHCQQPSLKISCKFAWKFLRKVANRQTNNDENITSLADEKKKQNRLMMMTMIVIYWSWPSLVVSPYSAPQCSHCKRCAIATAIPSVCPSVPLSHAGIVSKWLHVARCSLHCQIAKCV